MCLLRIVDPYMDIAYILSCNTRNFVPTGAIVTVELWATRYTSRAHAVCSYIVPNHAVPGIALSERITRNRMCCETAVNYRPIHNILQSKCVATTLALYPSLSPSSVSIFAWLHFDFSQAADTTSVTEAYVFQEFFKGFWASSQVSPHLGRASDGRIHATITLQQMLKYQQAILWNWTANSPIELRNNWQRA